MSAFQQQVSQPHGHKEIWEHAIQNLPVFADVHAVFDQDIINLSSTKKHLHQSKSLFETLQLLLPWRKGPFQIFDIFIDTEWRSDWKWQRLQPHISDLSNRKVLDVGCGSGYHCWRMRGAGASYVLGIDPSLLYWMQFRIFKNYIRQQPVFFLPISLEQFPKNTQFFDTVFSMGILYHRKGFCTTERDSGLRKGFLHSRKRDSVLQKGILYFRK